MASFNGNIDLLSLSGAQLRVGLDENSKERPYVCIPLDLNEIRLDVAKNDSNRQVAKLRVNIWPFSDAYKAKIRQSALERGDAEPNVPTHEMQIAYSIDFVKAAIKSYPRIVEQVKEANKDRAPQILTQNPEDETTQLFKLIQRRLDRRLAMLYQPKGISTPQPNYPQQVMNAAMGTSAYVLGADNMPDYSKLPGYDDPNSDLPF